MHYAIIKVNYHSFISYLSFMFSLMFFERNVHTVMNNKNRLLKRFLAFLLLCTLTLSLCACGDDFDIKQFIKKYLTDEGLVSRDAGYIETLENDEYEYEVYEDHVLLTAYKGESNEVILPSYIDGLPVTVIGSLCFYSGNNTVVSVIIPSTVTRLDDSAFYLCTELKSLTVPQNVKKIGERCFSWCQSLETVYLPDSITEIPDYCFNYCTSLAEACIPASCMKIGTRAFSYCSSLTAVTLPDSVTEIGARVFANCEKLDFLILSDNLKTIGESILTDSVGCLVVTSASSTAAMYCDTNSITFYTTLEAAQKAKGYDISQDQSEASEND